MKLEYEVFNREGMNPGPPMTRYSLTAANLDGNPDIYELVAELEDNCGHLRSYRDNKTTVAISLEAGHEYFYLTLVGDDEDQLYQTLDGIKSTVPNVLEFKLCEGGN